jgi:hypothetical protein
MTIRLLALSTLICASAAAQETAHGKLMAVLEFNTKLEGAQKKAVDVQYLADTVRAGVLDLVPDIRVMTRENEMVLLEQSGKKLSECEGECEVDTGRRLGADLVISGDLLKFGSAYKLNLKLHETHEGRLLAGAQASGRTIDELDADTQLALRKLLRPLTGGTEPVAKPKPQPRPQAQVVGPMPQTQTPPPPAQQGWPAGAHGSKVTIGSTMGGKTFDISVRAGGKVFNCPNRVTETASCELSNVPAGDATLLVRGDSSQDRDFSVPEEGIRIIVGQRSRWPTWVGLGLIGFGAIAIADGTQVQDTTQASNIYAGGAVIVAGGVVLLIMGLTRSQLAFDETKGEALLGRDDGKLRLAGLQLGPIRGGAMASAAFHF